VVYAPNPEAIVVAIDAGHGGCLDWGVPDPSARGVDLAEKTLTLSIGLRLRDRLRADGITVVMTRETDEALAGDDHPPLGCHGPPWRDVNGDGHVGFGSDLPRGTRARDELQARLDLANLARADALVSVHINAPSEDGETIEIAFTQTYYTDERAWAAANERLAGAVQAGVSAALGAVAEYERTDRGITAHNLYLVAPPLETPTDERPNPLAQPTRGALMPVALVEVGSITLRAEHDLLATPRGQDAVVDGLFDGLAEFFGDRPLAARIALEGDDGVPEPVDGSGPPFWPVVVDGPEVRLRVTNTGTDAWPAGARLMGAWEASDQPYLREAPADLAALGDVPALAPGESAVTTARLPEQPVTRGVAWISLMVNQTNISDAGSPALQVSTAAP
jgi:N-acetylmuramoyl-L-alanine amidase